MAKLHLKETTIMNKTLLLTHQLARPSFKSDLLIAHNPLPPHPVGS